MHTVENENLAGIHGVGSARQLHIRSWFFLFFVFFLKSSFSVPLPKLWHDKLEQQAFTSNKSQEKGFSAKATVALILTVTKEGEN